jgi:hypothetical protein
LAELRIADAERLIGRPLPKALAGLAAVPLKLTMGGVLYALGVLETIFGLVLTSLAITGFTGLLRGSE